MALDDTWMLKARCRGHPDPDPIFFPDTTKGHKPDIRRAKALCWECPVRKTCLVYAVAHKIPDGVWGGLGEGERKSIPKEVKLLYRRTWFKLHPLASRR